METENLIQSESQIQKRKYLYFLTGFFVLVLVYLYVHKPPKEFPLGQVITITSGESLQAVSRDMYLAHVIKFPFVFRVHAIIQGGEKRVIAGDYLLDQREGPANLAYRVVHGRFHLDSTKITIPEGWSVFQIADYLQKNLLNFNKSLFLSLAGKKEGYLFPDTYFVSPTIKPVDIILLMENNFSSKIKIASGIATSTHSLKDVITMASILEEEARTTESRRTVAGILWRRLSLGMPLQVDSTFSYINGKTTNELTLDDLKINSPYNTYLYTSLPPTPISNPGLDAINSALNPIETKYLYFLTSKIGVMYYARTFEEHKRNKEKYLNN